MGNFYVNIAVQGADQHEVAEFLAGAGRKAFVSAPEQGFVVVYDRECDDQDMEVIAGLSAELAARFRVPTLAVLNHDDDLLWYQLYGPEGLLDQYASFPGLLDEAAGEEPVGGDAGLLCQTLGKPDQVAAVEHILHEQEYIFAAERHRDLVAALGLPMLAVGLGYQDLMYDEPEGFIEVGGEAG